MKITWSQFSTGLLLLMNIAAGTTMSVEAASPPIIVSPVPSRPVIITSPPPALFFRYCGGVWGWYPGPLCPFGPPYPFFPHHEHHEHREHHEHHEHIHPPHGRH